MRRIAAVYVLSVAVVLEAAPTGNPLAAVHEALRLGVDVRGYLYWSMMDKFEWGSFVPRFGLVHVDFHTYQRTPKPSAFFCRNIIRARGLDSESARGITAVAGKTSE